MLISLSGYLRLWIDLRCHLRSSVLDVTLGTSNESRCDLECLVTLFSPNSDLTYVEESMIFDRWTNAEIEAREQVATLVLGRSWTGLSLPRALNLSQARFSSVFPLHSAPKTTREIGLRGSIYSRRLWFIEECANVQQSFRGPMWSQTWHS